ncbi:MAG: sulfotransferase domain-containing protein [Rhizomicrobium sp.]
MIGPVWLASYPKSGNTWFRIILANLSRDEPADINTLRSADWTAGNRAPFDAMLLIPSALLTHDEADGLRPRVHEALVREAADAASDGMAPSFVKVHDAYTLTPNGEPLLGGIAAGAILIVRDPRDVAPSIASHSRTTIDQAIAILNDRDGGICTGTRGVSQQFRQRLLDWSGHAASWIDQRDIPVHVARYEDLLADPVHVFMAAMAFAGRPADLDQVRRAIGHSAFPALQAQERASGFRERPRPGDALGGPFFRQGQAGAWRDTLTETQVAAIEQAHGTMMRRLGYELSRPAGGGMGG